MVASGEGQIFLDVIEYRIQKPLIVNVSGVFFFFEDCFPRNKIERKCRPTCVLIELS